jgi:hypothetical protein
MFHALAAALSFVLTTQIALAGEVKDRYVLPAHEDKFYREFGGRVFQIWCGSEKVYVWKVADGSTGYFDCRTWSSSSNAFEVVRSENRWVRR